jgi:exodeoxyribonuclease VII small subunit
MAAPAPGCLEETVMALPDLDPIDHMTYEQAFAELEKIVSALESDQRPLADATDLFERGQRLSAYCARLLDQAALKVSQLSGESMTELAHED